MTQDGERAAGAVAETSELGVDEFCRYSMIIDARTPHEYREDHIPGAVNLPVVSDAEFAEVGIAYSHDPHTAYLVGAEHVSRNIAAHIHDHIAKYAAGDRFLVYCFRGGKRSQAWADTLRNIGFATDVLKGGWKAYRRWVRAGLESLPPLFEYRVLCGPTGCGKTRLLRALDREGNQVLDLEQLASHRGSLLGSVVGEPQSSQKMFDSLLLDKLRRLDTGRPVWVEAESKKVGNLQLPDALFDAMRRTRPLQVTATMSERVLVLREDYPHFVSDPEGMVEKLAPLKPLVGSDELALWRRLAQERRVDELVERLLTAHYDDSYRRSRMRSSSANDPEAEVALSAADPVQLAAVARDLTRRFGERRSQR